MAAKTATAEITATACTCSVVTARTEDGKTLTTGCTATTKRTFAPGHDARLKGFLIRNGAEGNTVRLGDNGPAQTAQQVADGFGFGHMVADGIARAAKREFARTLREVAKAAKKSHETPREVTAKVGRWEYQGVITDSPEHGPQFTYTSKAGVQTTTTRFTRV